MMKTYLILFAAALILTTGCTSGEEAEETIPGDGIQVEDAWARPASEGRMSAAYFLITNFESEPDTLLSVESDVAEMVEVHESYETENNMMGMREVTGLELPAQSTIRFQQGGLHVMLIQVTRTLAEGDTFELTLNFALSEPQTVEIPVRL